MIDNLSWVAAYPEILLLVMACVIALVDLAVKSPLRGATYGLTLLTLASVAVLQGLYASSGQTIVGWSGMVVSDPMGNWLKCFAAIAMMVTLVYGRAYAGSRDMLRGGELFTLALFSLLGMFVMISGHNFLVIYLGLELLTLSAYALVALRRDDLRATEAAMKYFVLGALSSGILLYGMSMIYGATGHLDLGRIAEVIAAGRAERLPMVFGVVFIVSGLAFKLAVAPFHMWSPDVYDGSPTSVTLILGAAPKLAALAITLRLLTESLHGLAIDWQPMLMILAVLSLAVGNITALMQTSFKRMLAYSTISHMGFVLLGLLSGVVDGQPQAMNEAYGASLFYMVIYVLTTLTTFGLVLLLSRAGFESDQISDLKGLGKRHPLLAAVLLLSMFSLAGIPPLVGFYAKLGVLQALVGAGHVALAVAAVVFSLIGAFYYLRIVKVAYFDEPEGERAAAPYGGFTYGVMSVNGLLLVLFSLLPGGLMALCVRLIEQSLRF